MGDVALGPVHRIVRVDHPQDALNLVGEPAAGPVLIGGEIEGEQIDKIV
jgi:hypothetical protein